MVQNSERSSLTETVETIVEASQQGDETTVSEISDAVGRTSHLTAILFAASLSATPLSGVPGLSTVCGLIIATCAAQALLGRKKIWLPGFLRRKKVPNKRLGDALAWLSKGAAYLDGATQTRFRPLVRGAARKMLLSLFLVGGLMMPILEFIPFSASIVAGTIAFFSAALLTRDGLWVAWGMGLIGLAATGAVWAF